MCVTIGWKGCSQVHWLIKIVSCKLEPGLRIGCPLTWNGQKGCCQIHWLMKIVSCKLEPGLRIGYSFTWNGQKGCSQMHERIEKLIDQWLWSVDLIVSHSFLYNKNIHLVFWEMIWWITYTSLLVWLQNDGTDQVLALSDHFLNLFVKWFKPNFLFLFSPWFLSWLFPQKISCV